MENSTWLHVAKSKHNTLKMLYKRTFRLRTEGAHETNEVTLCLDLGLIPLSPSHVYASIQNPKSKSHLAPAFQIRNTESVHPFPPLLSQPMTTWRVFASRLHNFF